ncbi:hypothetical protein DOTSEDRAFT_69216 [Dothistroma septosporum NZE10]|uniref:Uncharacterized protein n=1 Tax=Dothistroma septosporum (strain NZE10 / CBS 128990) TaxID=675120 RepID=N1PUZ2_DOTSN|nr:hypothetical protein DOTSEDRAFT_69216 [Dothistroma septosporum NZE10]
MADIKLSDHAVAQGGAPGSVDASIAQPSVGEAAAQPAGGVAPSEAAEMNAKTEATKITKPAAKTDQKKATSGNLLSKLMFWKKDKNVST